MNELPVLPFTGERFTPECVREIWYEHIHRYAFAQALAAGKYVLDAACGEGYGSALLADVAESVVGVDISQQAIDHARGRYADRRNLRFELGDATQLDVPDHSIDLVVSFETLEHLTEHDALIDGFARVLRDDGILLISSPDKATYTDASGFQNEFHVRELYRQELLDLLSARFPHVRLYGQKLLFQSVLWAQDAENGPASAASSLPDGQVQPGLAYAPLYFVAMCSRRPLPEGLPSLHLFGDREESVYAHYNHEIRKNIEAGGRIAELEAEIAALRLALAAKS